MNNRMPLNHYPGPMETNRSGSSGRTCLTALMALLGMAVAFVIVVLALRLIFPDRLDLDYVRNSGAVPFPQNAKALKSHSTTRSELLRLHPHPNPGLMV